MQKADKPAAAAGAGEGSGGGDGEGGLKEVFNAFVGTWCARGQSCVDDTRFLEDQHPTVRYLFGPDPQSSCPSPFPPSGQYPLPSHLSGHTPQPPTYPLALGWEEAEVMVDVTFHPSHSLLRFLADIRRTDFLAWVFVVYLRRTVEACTHWPTAQEKELNTWAQAVFCRVAGVLPTTQHLLLHPLPETGVQKFREHCVEIDCAELALLLDVCALRWKSVASISNPQHCPSLAFPDLEFCSKLFWFCYVQGQPYRPLLNLADKLFDEQSVRCLHFNTELFHKQQLTALAEQCARMFEFKWQAFFLIKAKDWTSAITLVLSHQNEDASNVALLFAAAEKKFDIVNELFESCSLPDVLAKVRQLVRLVQARDCLSIQEYSQTSSRLHLHHLYLTNQAVLCTVIHISALLPDGEDTDFARLCIQRGLSTCYPQGRELCCECISLNKPRLLTMFLESGVVKYQEYYQALADPRVKASLRRHPALQTEVESRSRHLQAKSPPSLALNALLKVNAALGYQPHRAARVRHLQHITDQVKDALMFPEI
ncbi:hypothetical protein ACOMHN_061643 [Nucella lapillus]